MATTIVRYDAEAVLCEEQHLGVPHVGVQRPSVREGYDRALAPVLVINRRAVFHRDRAHANVSCIAIEPLVKPNLATLRIAARNERALTEFRAEVARVRVSNDFTRIVP